MPFKRISSIGSLVVIGAGRTGQELTVFVSLKNIGKVMASKINLTLDNPPSCRQLSLEARKSISDAKVARMKKQ